MNKLQELVNRCKAGVYLTINAHKDDYSTVNDYIHSLGEEEQGEMTDYAIHQMIENNTIIRLQFYPHTPIGSYVLYHWDLDMVLEQALRTFDDE